MQKTILCLVAFTISCATIQPASKSSFELSEIDAIKIVKDLTHFFVDALFPVVPEVADQTGPGLYLRDAAIGEYWLQFFKGGIGLTVRRCAQYDLDVIPGTGNHERLKVFVTRHNNQKLYVWYTGQYEASLPWTECGALVILGRVAGAKEREFIRLSTSDLLRIKAADNPYTKTADTIECAHTAGKLVTFISVERSGV